MRTTLLFAMVVLFTCIAFAGNNPRVYITDSQSWEIEGGGGGSSDGFGARSRGGARPQTAEIVKTFHERCPNAIINNKREKADYVIVLDHEGGKDLVRRDNKIAIFAEPSGDAIFSRSTRSLGNAVKDSCAAMFRDWSRREAEAAGKKSVEGTDRLPVAVSTAGARVQVTSAPAGADIEIDGAFMGSTPSTIQLTPGTHKVVVTKNGFSPWQRTIHVTGGEITLAAELARTQ